MAFIFALAAFASTLLGGLATLRFKDKLHLILGLSAGAVIGLAFFDLLPEGARLQGNVSAGIIWGGAGFFIYLILDRLLFHHGHTEECNHGSSRGIMSAASLSVHSFLDGAAIGLAYQSSAALGLVVALAVLMHDFSDGINTVGFILKAGGSRRTAFGWLLVDAFAPIVGVISTFFFALSDNALGVVLSLFAGFFLYIGASDLLPESHHRHPTHWTTIMTLLGAALIFTIVRFAHI